MDFLPAGPDALLVEVDDQDAVAALHAEIRRRRADGWAPTIVDVVPGARTILLDGVADPAGLAAQIASWTAPDRRPPPDRRDDRRDDRRPPAPATDGGIVEVPCIYDGPDLADIADRWGVAVADVAGIHAGIVHEVAFCGFAPGFAYMTGIGDDRAVPRRPSPRATVPGGSIGLAGPYTGIYPRPSPGGWNLIARTDLAVWDADRDPPALLGPGTRVRFVDAGARFADDDAGVGRRGRGS